MFALGARAVRRVDQLLVLDLPGSACSAVMPWNGKPFEENMEDLCKERKG